MLLYCAGDIVEECEVRRAFDRAPHLPVAGTSAASPFDGRLQVGIPIPDDVIPTGHDFQVSALGSGSFAAPLGGVGCLCCAVDTSFWQAAVDSDGCRE